MSFEWKIAEGDANDIIGTLLKNRGIKPEDAEVFLNPDWERDTHDPFSFTQMNRAVQRVFKALEAGEKIKIHGDYDADGISGSTLLFGALTEIRKSIAPSSSPIAGGESIDSPPVMEGLGEANVSVFLPDRERDGYGVAVHNIEKFAADGVTLLITVDCGISNIESLSRAHELGIDVIICDHHQLAPTIPEHAMIIHPLAPGETYPNKTLCGTGVAFKLASALFTGARARGAKFPPGHERWYLDLVAIATVTDVMPLTGENRALEKFGLMVLNKTRREGIRKIVDFSRSELGKIDTEAIGFQIGPRINAAGRIASAHKAFQTLSAKDPEEARKLASELEQLNRERQRISDLVFQQAKSVAREKKNAFVSVIWQEDWMHGVVGLVAGKLVQEFGVPAFVFTKVGDHYVGSGRSIGGMHLVEAMRSCGDIFVKAGGHPQACGLTIADLDRLMTFEDRVTEFAKTFFGGQAATKSLAVDAEIPLKAINWELVRELEKFEPFGEGNRRPKFMSSNMQVVAAEPIGSDGKHLRLTVNDEAAGMMKLIGFGFGQFGRELRMGDLIDVVYEIGVNEWNGRREIQLKIEDLRKHDKMADV